MHWVIQDNLHKDKATLCLIDNLEKFKIDHTLVKVIPFIGEIDPDINPINPVICIGSYSFRHVAKRKNWNPGVFDIGHIHYHQYPEKWKSHLINNDSIYCTMNEVLNHFETKEDQGVVFVRPSVDSKFINGNIYTKKEIEDIINGLSRIEPDPSGLLLSSPMMISSPKNILYEYRFWVVDKEIITWSLYKRGEKVIYSNDIDIDILDFAKSVIKDVNFSRAYVIDIAKLPDNSFKIIETNTFNSSGFYAADIQKIIFAIEDMLGY